MVALGDCNLPWLVHPYDHFSRDLARHPVDIVLRAVVIDQLNLIWHLILIAVVHRVSDVLSLVTELHQRLHHLLIVLGIALWVGGVLKLLTGGRSPVVVVCAGDAWPRLQHVAYLLLLYCPRYSLRPTLLHRLCDLHFFAVYLSIHDVRLLQRPLDNLGGLGAPIHGLSHQVTLRIIVRLVDNLRLLDHLDQIHFARCQWLHSWSLVSTGRGELTFDWLHHGVGWVLGRHHCHPSLLALVEHCFDIGCIRIDRLHELRLAWLTPLGMQRRLPLLLRASLRPLHNQVLIIVIPTQLLLLDMRVGIECALSSAHASLLLAAVRSLLLVQRWVSSWCLRRSRLVKVLVEFVADSTHHAWNTWNLSRNIHRVGSLRLRSLYHLLLRELLLRLPFEVLRLLLRIDLTVDHRDVARGEVVLALPAEAPRLLFASDAFLDLRLLVVRSLVLLVCVCQLPMESHQVLVVRAGHAHICLRRWPLVRVRLLALAVPFAVVVTHLTRQSLRVELRSFRFRQLLVLRRAQLRNTDPRLLRLLPSAPLVLVVEVPALIGHELLPEAGHLVVSVGQNFILALDLEIVDCILFHFVLVRIAVD